MNSALVQIIARIMAIINLVLEQFVTIDYINSATCGGGTGYLVANITCLGQNLAENIANTISSVIALIPNLLQGLSVITNTN